jgi:hypothetical protein
MDYSQICSPFISSAHTFCQLVREILIQYICISHRHVNIANVLKIEIYIDDIMHQYGEYKEIHIEFINNKILLCFLIC